MARDRIEVHQHFLPPAYASWLRERGVHETARRAAGHRALDRESAHALFNEEF
jgi:hypothetical protein